MDFNKKILFSLLIVLTATIGLYTYNSFNDIIYVSIIATSAYLLFYKRAQVYIKTNSYLGIIFSAVFYIGFLLVIWISNRSMQLGDGILPYLPGDGLPYYQLGDELANTNLKLADVSLNYAGYPLLLSVVFKLFGTSVIIGVLVNYLTLIFNILLVSECSVLVTKRHQNYKISFVLLILTAQFISSGFIILKDIHIVTAVSLSLYASLKIFENGKTKYYILLALSVLIMSLFRFTFIFVPAVVFLAVNFDKKRIIKSLPLIIIIMVAGIAFGNKFALTEKSSISENLDSVLSNTVISSRLDENSSGFVSSVLYGYDTWGIMIKTILLPLTTIIQYLLPFNVYQIQNGLHFPYYFISNNFNVFWLVFVGPVFIFTIYNNIKHSNSSKNKLLSRITTLGFLLYLFPAFMFGGAIPRYAIVFIPLIIPAMANIYNLTLFNSYWKNKWRVFLKWYIFIAFVSISGFLLFKGLF